MAHGSRLRVSREWGTRTGPRKHIPAGEPGRSWPSTPPHCSRLPGRSAPSETHRFWRANVGLGEVFSQAARKKKKKKSQIGQVAISCESCSPRLALCHLPRQPHRAVLRWGNQDLKRGNERKGDLWTAMDVEPRRVLASPGCC